MVGIYHVGQNLDAESDSIFRRTLLGDFTPRV